MAKISKARLGIWLLGTALFCFLTAQFSPGFSLSPLSQSQAEIVSELAQADIVYLGETHDSVEDHQAQLDIIQALFQKNSQIAIALEMFQRPYQPVLDRYLAGEIDEAQLREQSEYDQRWGFDWEYYAPILRFAQAHQLPVLALNTPTEVTRKVARQGLESLSPQERRYIPPFSEIRTDNEAYRQMIQEVYALHAHGGHGNSEDFERFFTTQVLWDETMAEKIAQFWQANPNYQVVVLAGRGHIIYGYGIPSRVSRRLAGSSVTGRSVLMGNQEADFKEERSPADFYWEHD